MRSRVQCETMFYSSLTLCHTGSPLNFLSESTMEIIEWPSTSTKSLRSLALNRCICIITFWAIEPVFCGIVYSVIKKNHIRQLRLKWFESHEQNFKTFKSALCPWTDNGSIYSYQWEDPILDWLITCAALYPDLNEPKARTTTERAVKSEWRPHKKHLHSHDQSEELQSTEVPMDQPCPWWIKK